MTSKEMRRAKCGKGNWFWSIAPLGEVPDWVIVPEPTEPGDPNHPDYEMKLFGYEVKEFTARQYR